MLALGAPGRVGDTREDEKEQRHREPEEGKPLRLVDAEAETPEGEARRHLDRAGLGLLGRERRASRPPVRRHGARRHP